MRTLTLFTLCLLLTACATRVRLTPEELEANRRRQEELTAKANAEREAKERADMLRQFAIEASEKPGVMRASFDSLHDPPTSVEYRDGKTIYWYRDTNPPMYFEFKNDKLVGKYIDKETLALREEQAERSRDREAQAAQAERMRRMMILQGFQRSRPQPSYQAQPYMMPTTRPSTNCRSTRVGDTTYTTCD